MGIPIHFPSQKIHTFRDRVPKLHVGSSPHRLVEAFLVEETARSWSWFPPANPEVPPTIPDPLVG